MGCEQNVVSSNLSATDLFGSKIKLHGKVVKKAQKPRGHSASNFSAIYDSLSGLGWKKNL